MYKKLFMGFVFLLSLLVINPALSVQYSQESRDINFVSTTIPISYHNYTVTSDTALDIEQITQFAAEIGVNLFYVKDLRTDVGVSEGTTNYLFLTEPKYMKQMPFVEYSSVEEFNNSIEVYSTDSRTHPIEMVLNKEKVSVTSLKNLTDELYGSLIVTSHSEAAIHLFIDYLGTSFGDIELTRNLTGEMLITRKPVVIEFFTILFTHFRGAEVGAYSVFILLLLCLLMQLSADSRKIIIQKAHGYSNSHIIISYLRDFLIPIFLIGNVVFCVGYFLYGGNISSFPVTLLKYQLFLLVFAAIVTILLTFATSLIMSMQPIDLIKERKPKTLLISYLAVIKILLILTIIPALTAQIIQAKEFWNDYKYQEEERIAFNNYYRVQTVIPPLGQMDFDYPEFYMRLKDTPVMFSREIVMYGGFGLDEKLRLIMTNSEMVNQSGLKANDEYIHIPQDEQALIVSHDVDIEQIKKSPLYQDNFLCSGNLNQAACEDVKIIQLDPGQKFLANNTSRQSPMLERFMLTVNTFVPNDHYYYYYYKDLSSEDILYLETRLNEGLDRKLFGLIFYVDGMPVSGNTQRFINEMVSVSALIITVVFTTVLLYLSIIDLYKKSLVVAYLHGTGLHTSLLPPMLISIAANTVLGYLSLSIGRNFFRATTTEQLSSGHFFVALIMLGILEVVLWLLASRVVRNKLVQAINS